MERWISLVVDGLARQHLPEVSAAMFGLGAVGVAEEGDRGVEPPLRQVWDVGPPEPPAPTVRLRAWFESPDDALRAAAVATLPQSVDAHWEAAADEDWSTAWRVNFPVLRFGRLVVAPPWEAEPGVLVLEPGQGFGTGQHPTTRQVLERLVRVLDATVPAGERVLDVGCGSGILALAAAYLGAEAYGIDHDPVAVADARTQAARNALDVSFDTMPLDGVPGRWSIVLANLFADTHVALADALIERTGRHLILGGILADRERGVREVFDPRLGEPDRWQDGDWVCLHYQSHDAASPRAS